MENSDNPNRKLGMKVFVKVSTMDRKPVTDKEVIGLWDAHPNSTCVVAMDEKGYWYAYDPFVSCDCDQPDYWLEEQEGLSNEGLISDRLFIQEIINDLEKNGYISGGKAETMLKDWSREMRNKTFLNGKTKAKHAEWVGRQLY